MTDSNDLVELHSKACPGCGKSTTLLVAPEQVERLAAGGFVQDVLPSLHPVQRERFISGYCGPCWRKMFA